jgi:ribosome-binding protein aMBF1 (putative translation factor)
MFKPCVIKTDSGDELVILSRRQYEDLCNRKETSESIEELVSKFIEGGEGWLAAERKARRWSQSRLARASGVSQSYICRLENEWCEHKPSRGIVERLASALNVDPNYGAWGW